MVYRRLHFVIRNPRFLVDSKSARFNTFHLPAGSGRLVGHPDKEAPAWNTQLSMPTTITELQQFEALLTPHPPNLPDFIARDLVRTSEKNAWVVQRALGTMLTGQNTTDTLLPHLKMPMLIVWGRDDQIFPLRQGETMHHLTPQSQLEVFTGCHNPGKIRSKLGAD